MYMVLDRLEGGSVDGLWREQGKLAEDHAAHIILQVVSAVRYCHDRNIAVRGEGGRIICCGERGEGTDEALWLEGKRDGIAGTMTD